jgi:uncharacterized protein DUF4432
VRYERGEFLRRVGRLEQVAGVRQLVLGDGGGRGVRFLEFRTGTGFEFDVLVDRGFDVGRCEHSGRALGWLSPVGVEGPWFYEPEGLGWLRGFGGGFLTTCGLDHTLFMTEDTAAQYHYPPKPTEIFGLHGRVSYRPARLAGYGERWDGDECTLWAEGEVLQASVFGEQLLLRRRIEARVGESRLQVHDVVENVGHDLTPHMYLYHVNVGFPVLDQAAEILVQATGVAALGEHAVEGYRLLAAPSAEFVQHVFQHELAVARDGTVRAAVVNRPLGLGAYEVFRQAQLPHHFVWRMLGEGTYVVGIEPSTNRAAGRLDARDRGELILLGPNETREYDLELGALVGEGEIEQFAERIDEAVAGA